MDVKIRLSNVQHTSVDLKVNTFDAAATNRLSTSIKISAGGSSEDENSFGITFKVALTSPDKHFKLVVESTAHFECSIKVDEDFMESSFAKVSAPAIAFPYIRSFISLITLNAGFNPINLPSYNFVAMAKEDEKPKKLKK